MGARRGVDRSVITDDGRINENGAPYTGMMRFDVRVKLEEDLKKLGLYVGKKDNKMQIPICSRSGDIVEPLLKPQWYVDARRWPHARWRR